MIDALKNTELDFSKLSKEQIQAQIQEKKEKEELLKKANEIGQKESEGKFTKEEGYSIIQGRVGYTNPTSKKPILRTYGAGPCIIVAMRNPKTQETTLAHIDVSLDQNKTLNNMISTIQGSENEKLEVHLRGGNDEQESIVQAKDLLKYLSERNDIEIKSCNLITNTSDQLTIDSRTGEIFTYFQIKQLEEHPNAETLLQTHATSSQINVMAKNRQPARIQFDGRKPENQKPLGKWTAQEQNKDSQNNSQSFIK